MMVAAVEVERFDVATSDGRVLEVAAAGPGDGAVLFMHHGTPSGGEIYPPVAIEAAQRDLRTVAYSRPGYAGSSRHEGRSIVDCAADTAAIADHLGADRFFVTGGSGGGPHALACAALLPERVLACATIAGVGPWGADDLDFLDGMAPENHEEFGAALAGPDELRAVLGAWREQLADVTADQVAGSLGELVSPPDVAALTGEFATFTATSFHRAVSSGIWGWFDDDRAFTRPWGFELDTIRVPVRIWQGEQDRMVPAAHARWLAAHVPGARAEVRPEHGHLSLGLTHAGAIFDALLEDGGTR